MKGMRIRTRTAVVRALVTLCIPGIFGCMGIRGGTELVIRVQVEEAVNAKTDQELERLRDRMTANGIPYDGVSKKASLEFDVQGVPQDSHEAVVAVMTLAVQTRSDLRAEATKLEKPAHELQPPVC